MLNTKCINYENNNLAALFIDYLNNFFELKLHLSYI